MEYRYIVRSYPHCREEGNKLGVDPNILPEDMIEVNNTLPRASSLKKLLQPPNTSLRIEVTMKQLVSQMMQLSVHFFSNRELSVIHMRIK